MYKARNGSMGGSRRAGKGEDVVLRFVEMAFDHEVMPKQSRVDLRQIPKKPFFYFWTSHV